MTAHRQEMGQFQPNLTSVHKVLALFFFLSASFVRQRHCAATDVSARRKRASRVIQHPTPLNLFAVSNSSTRLPNFVDLFEFPLNTLSPDLFGKALICISFAFVMHVAIADSVLLECSTPPATLIDGLSRTACEISRSVMVEHYSGPKPAQPYASEFDRREVAIAIGKKAESVTTVAGIRAGPRAVQIQTSLLYPPFVDQIAKRYPTPKARRYKRWVIAYEQIEYGAQGSEQGFPLECATAVHSTTRATKIVAECFPLEERARFLKTLDAVQGLHGP